MMCFCDFSITLDIGVAVIALCGITVFIFSLCSNSKLKKSDFEINECELGLSGSIVHLTCNKNHKQIAYKIWVDINTRVLGVKIDLEKDIIRVVNDSLYKCFTDTRELLKEIPVTKINDSKLVDLVVRFLNDVIRPYLTKWGVRFNKWYDNELTNNPSCEKMTPVEIQRNYPFYDDVSKDLLSLNKKIVRLSKELHNIAFSK